ncbi:MAG: phosphatase PAP2 family protein [Actinomycetia bacterium]|nr:phosphatase PAP2 family protein [Actinomycetes bacterium]
MEAGTESDLRRLGRNAAWTSAGSAVALALLWAVFVEAGWGQSVDDMVLESRRVTDLTAIARNASSLGLITNSSLALGCLALLVVAAACVVGAATVTTEVLKKLVIDRPALIHESAGISGNSFPSGHTTISTALALAVLLVVPVRWRKVAGVVGALWITFQATGVVATGWHRPSDAVAGYAVSLGWAAFAVAALARLGRADRATEGDEDPRSAWALILFALLMVGLVTSVLVGGASPFNLGGLSFVLASALIDALGIGIVVGFLWLVRGWSLGRPPASGTGQSARSVGFRHQGDRKWSQE